MARGQVIERKTGYTVRVFVGRDAKGKRIYRNQRVTGTKKDAKKVLTAMLQKLDTGELLINPSLQTIEEYMKDWLETIAKPRLARRTHQIYTHYVQSKILPEIGKRKISRLEPRDIQKIYSGILERGLSPRTVRYTHMVLNSALKHAVGQRMLPSNPCQHVQLPKLKDREMAAMDDAEIKAFLEAAQTNRMRVYFNLLIATGLRPSEALALKWKDFDPMKKTLRVVRALEYVSGKAYFKEPKTKRSRRTINLHDGTVKLLLDHKEESLKSELIFPSNTGEPLDVSNVLERYFKPCMLKAGLAEEDVTEAGNKVIRSKFRMYDLRHTHATMLLKANVHPKIVSERLGHSSVSITLDTYSHVLPTIQEAAVDAIGASLYEPEVEEETQVALN